MSLLAKVTPQEATGTVAEEYARIEAALGRVPEAFQLYSLSPELLSQQWQFLGYYFRHPTLSGPLLAFMRLSISDVVRCDYCIDVNAGLLLNLFGWSPEQLAAARHDRGAAPLSERERVLLEFCVDAARSMGRVDPARLAVVRAAGWSDRDILDAVLHASRSVAADILFNTFGLESEGMQ
jgi:alkylhydroperoxidase family enzyme